MDHWNCDEREKGDDKCDPEKMFLFHREPPVCGNTDSVSGWLLRVSLSLFIGESHYSTEENNCLLD